ncbi:MAG: TIGR03013 family PEP-CTERM/XrtA system glycosyltransferase [Betaproteobacteria bacterium]|nr:TIGR03013 family PEP-CTERM/XrtA system glycosyltransferase [Betaproteobacteria bacterium]
MLVQLGAELCGLFAVILLTLRFAAHLPIPTPNAYSFALVFALVIVSLNGVFGLYRHIENLTFGAYLMRAALAPAIGIPLAYLVTEVLPGGESFQEHVVVVGLSALVGLLLVRHTIVLPLVHAVMSHRVLVLGTGPEAQFVEASLARVDSKGIALVGFYAPENGEPVIVSAQQLVTADRRLEDHVRKLRVDEIIVAVRQQRGGVLPLRSLLECRLNGVQITDMARYFERVQGRIPIDLVKASWMIYGNGYRQGWLRTINKRTTDVVIATLLLVLTLPVMAIAAAMIVVESGVPVIYRQTRVGRRGKHFTMLKLRSMAPDAESADGPRWAGVNDSRVTRIGRLIRRTRIDELPQLINVIRGEMSLVGPRPERPEFVAMLTEKLPFYAVRHSVKPGLTGWAQVRYSYGATVEQSMKKLEYDLYYVKNHTLVLDLQIVLETIRVVLFGEGAR